MVSRFQGSGRENEGGLLATHKQDSNAHNTGGDFRHDADHIDMNPPITTFPASNVQGTLELVAGFISSTGSGFVSVGDIGTDGYATGAYNVGDAATPTFRSALLAAFADDRLQSGGIVFVLPGTYKLGTTVDIPAGISIMGEIAGTVIDGDMTEQPMFKFLCGEDFPTIGGDSGSGSITASVGTPIDESRLFNLTLIDNLDGYAGSSGLPNTTMQTVPMVQMETSSRVHIENVKFIGKVNNGPEATRAKTLCAIGTTSGGVTESHLTVKRCFFDGMQTAINFSPGNGDIDHLTIDQCKGRVFGEEGTFTLSSLNCFASMSLCNLVATNNHIVGYGAFLTQFIVTCFVVSSAGSGGTDVSILVTGTTGEPSSGNAMRSHSVFFVEDSGITSVKAVVTNNNWASDIGSKWFVTVGDGGSVFDDGFGDFYGSGAIDLVLALPDYPVTVIVNSGIYEVTSETTNGTSYNFIGNLSGSRPIFDMNLGVTAATDQVSNRTLVLGERTENIHFRSSTAQTGTTSFHSIRPDVTEGALVKNCKFENCTLSFDDTISSAEVIDCVFLQDNTFSDNICLLAPIPSPTEHILIERCQFSGNGYVGLIGEDTALGYSTSGSRNLTQVIIRDCVMDLTNFTIDDASPLSLSAYFAIDGDDSNTTSPLRVEMTGCKIVCDNSFTQRTSAIALTVSMDSFFVVRAGDIHIDNCIIHSPTQWNTSNDPLPGALFAPNNSIRITNSKFIDGGVPCQISGLGGFAIKGGEHSGVVIDGCHFHTSNDPLTPTLLDVDLDNYNQSKHVNVNVSNSTFDQPYDSDGYGVEHFDLIGDDAYILHGIVQIYAFEYAVNFHDNVVNGNVVELSDGGSPVQNSGGGVIIETLYETSGAKANIIRPINVHDNKIYIDNSATIGASDAVAALCVSGIEYNIHNNYIRFANTAAITGEANCLRAKNLTTQSAVVPPDSMIHHNTFSRRDDAGTLRNVSSYVEIITGSQVGRMVENIFDEPTVDGTITDVISDLSSSWAIHNNRNQTETFELSGHVGRLSNAADGSYDPWIRGVNPTTLKIGMSQDHTPNVVNVEYTAAGTEYFMWHIDLFGLLPEGVEIISATITGTATAATLVAGVFYVTLHSGAALLTSSTPSLDFTSAVGPTTGVLTAAAGTRNTAANRLFLMLAPLAIANGIQGAGNVDIEFKDFIITYRW